MLTEDYFAAPLPDERDELIARLRQQFGEARQVATSLVESMIDISEQDIHEEGREWTAEGMRACVGMAYEAIRQNEWFFGGRPKPVAQRAEDRSHEIHFDDGLDGPPPHSAEES